MYVIDASVYVSRLRENEPHYAASRELLAAVQAKGIAVACPNLVWIEVAAAVRRGTGDPGLARAAVRALMRLRGHTFPGIDDALARAAAELAGELGLRGADAVYVALARRLGWTLLTLDQEQSRRARGLVPTLSPQEVLAGWPETGNRKLVTGNR